MIRSFDGKTPCVAESALVSEVAYVVGDVEIGEDSGIWPGAVVRGDVSRIKIGSRTMVQDNTVVHADVPMEIGDNVNIGHSVVVHGVKIGNNVLIGNNATILDDVEIGDFCVIGANCMVSRGMKIPDNSFVVGVPAKIRGQITPEQRQRLERGPLAYLKLAPRYKEQGM